jgi:carbon monoxide dehydrogenase subunit G
MTGEVVLTASRAAVWAALNDPNILKRCIPGCQELTKLCDSEFEAAVKIAVGPVKASFKGKVELSNIEPGNSYRIVGEGQGGVAGFAKGGATIQLKDIPGGTCLTYDVDAQVGGKIAQLGGRLIDGVVKRQADQFFGSLAKLLASAETKQIDAVVPFAELAGK